MLSKSWLIVPVSRFSGPACSGVSTERFLRPQLHVHRHALLRCVGAGRCNSGQRDRRRECDEYCVVDLSCRSPLVRVMTFRLPGRPGKPPSSAFCPREVPLPAAVGVHDVDSSLPALELQKAIIRPSGDQRGCSPNCVSRRCPLPSAFMTKIPRPLSKAIFRPSGHQAGLAPMPFPVVDRPPRQVPLPAPVGVHDVDVQAVAVAAREGDLPPVGRPDAAPGTVLLFTRRCASGAGFRSRPRS